ncbi:MAG: hypothetical protein PHY74_00520 [Candidatus Bathyarchaeota archaeon]|nr:hypothetical protein [Candidatus Bathyarchaeota archaeon]MDD4324800.1 hypothetical protein [Candidatus Bathyarchaeota archaeon]MDI9576750.1 hypothetical protein [Thermoproteota archaeon]MDT8781445.1 hypothetical protein [Candidatus Bathyarchaeota archaeon]NLD65399.1 hypothetical protein [Thermoproteota archaeon]
MLQKLITHPIKSQLHLSLNMSGVDCLFSGFTQGDFAVLYGSPAVTPLMSLLCVRAQLPTQLGGLSSNVVFIDGGNTFRENNIMRLAQLHHLNPTEACQRIIVSKAFTAYQLTSLIMEKLEETVEKYNSKIVIISDISGLFLDSQIPKEEIKGIYSQIVRYLSNFAKKKQIIIVASCLPYSENKRNKALQEITITKANTVLSVIKTQYTSEINLEKHPRLMLGTAEMPSENMTLTSFIN